MNNYKTRAQLKGEVKDLVRGRWSTAVLLYLIPTILMLANAGSGGSRSSSDYTSATTSFNFTAIVTTAFSSGIIIFLLSLIFLIVSLSATFRGLDWIEDPELEFSPIKSNFTYFRSPDWWKLIFIYIINNIFVFLWYLLLIVPGIVKSIAYSQTFFVYKDLNDRGLADNYSLTDYITRSRQLMNGNKWRYFVLQLSFIGWFILGGITLGIGFFWIFPYYKLTMANFYHDLVANENN